MPTPSGKTLIIGITDPDKPDIGRSLFQGSLGNAHEQVATFPTIECPATENDQRIVRQAELCPHHHARFLTRKRLTRRIGAVVVSHDLCRWDVIVVN